MYSFYSPRIPCISVFLEGPSAIFKMERLRITVKVTYEGLTNEEFEASLNDTKPIIIHTYPFFRDNFRLQRRCRDYDPLKNSDEEWKSYFDDERKGGWLIVDEPDVQVNVANSQFFRSLQPGASWIEPTFFEFFDLHPDTVVGDTYRYQYWGGYMDWWTWGDQEENAQTVVKLPCWLIANVVDPPDNDGRPSLLIPSSNFVEFTVVD